MKDTIKKLLLLFDKKEKSKFLIIFLMMLIAAVFETVSIGVIVPFVGIITNPEVIKEHYFFSKIYEILNFQSNISFIIFSVIVLIIIFILKNLYLIFYNFVQFKVVLNLQVKLSTQLFKAYLNKPYKFHLERNSSELLRNVNTEVATVFQGIILAGLALFTELLITASILLLLIWTATIATSVAAIILVGSLLVFFKVFRKKISHLGKEHQLVNAEKIKWINQGLGASKEVKVSGKEGIFIDEFRKYSLIGVKNIRHVKLLELVPKFFIETILVATVLITVLIIIVQGKETGELVSTIALFAMASFRLMPSITRIMTLITGIKYSQPAFQVIYEDIYNSKDLLINYREQIELHEIENRLFKESIKVNNVSFRYSNQSNYTIKDISLTIPVGESVAFIGESGAGKTTIVDIILGLLNPDEGEILVDNKNLGDQYHLWQQKIGYIPQTIYLSDDTIRNNVAFGYNLENISDKEVWRALEQAQLKEFVSSLPNKLETYVGENGVRLSGGQRQRIGIARALYHNPEILFMDEATSALDSDTETEIIKTFNNLKGEKTLIIIAHRLSTIESCDTIFEIRKGKLVSKKYQKKNTTYDDVLKN